eukprot:TRINITY_DN51425_c0_g1_i1.p1 TRINITY_DN51425_c0_g1~~TRINITY_DN51425_c0_g1_i1.p1  ORF type:complete len:427 (+),score=80.15 TRINITY_DN51425_c0_g1_i1:79-1281(+)
MHTTKHDESEWFGPHVGPQAAIATYRSAPPRGMTNPPQNPEVRRKLMQELEEYGTQLQVERWPPPAPDLKAGFVFGLPTAPPSCRAKGAKLAQDLARKHLTWLRDGDTYHIANRLADQLVEVKPSAQEPSPGAPDVKSSARGSSAGGKRDKKLGASASAPALGAKGQKEKDAKEGKGPQKAPKDAGAKQASRSSAGQKGSSGQRHLSKDKSDKAQTEGVKQDGQAAEVVKRGEQGGRTYTEKEMENSMIVLRSQSRLHTAAVSDRFRFGADLKAAGGMVLKGAGSTPSAPGAWAADGSELNKFHNKAIRLVNPSNLPLLPMEKPKKKKKKADEDELTMGERALYEADKSYRNIRKIRRQFYPDSFEKERTKKEEAVATVSNLLAGGGLSLGLGGGSSPPS